MRKIILLSLFSIIGLNANVYDTKIEKIKQPRTGIEKSLLQDTKEPFAIIKITEEKKEMVIPDVVVKEDTVFVLNARINDKVYLNGSWKKEGDVIEGYTLKYIGKKGIVLRKGKEIKKVFFSKGSTNKLNIIVK